MIVVVGLMVQDVCAMEQKEPKKEKGPKGPRRSFSLSVPETATYKAPLSFSTDSVKKSPHSSPNLSASSSPNISPRHSPKDTIKISPKKSSKGDLKDSYQEFFENQLWQAVQENDTQEALKFIQPNMNIVDSTGKTLLVKAIRNRNEEIVEALLKEENIDVNLADKSGNTPLHHAILACHEAIIKLLLTHYRVDFSLKGNGGILPQQLTDHSFYEDKNELKKMIEARTVLDIIVNDTISAWNGLQNDKDNKDPVQDVISTVKQLTGLPHYATYEFIKNMLLHRAPLMLRSM